MNTKTENDWRLDMYRGHLNGSTFRLEKFVSTPTNDHEHCVFCMGKITDLDVPDCEKEGYVTVYERTGQTQWICKECFDEFKELCNFKVE